MSDADADTDFRPRSAPQGVVPADLIPKRTALTRRKRGRPPMVPTTLAAKHSSFALKPVLPSGNDGPKDPKRSTSLEAQDTPSKESGSTTRASKDASSRPSRSKKSSPLKDDLLQSLRPSNHLIHVPTPKAQPKANLERAYSEWMAQMHNTPDHRAVGDMAGDSDTEHDGSVPDDESDDEFQPCRVPNVHVSKEALRPLRKSLAAEDGYERKEIRLSHLLRFFAETDIELTLESHTVHEKVKFKWLDGPGFHPSDIRARRLELKFPHKLARKSPDMRIWRVRYRCNGFCSHHISGQNAIRPAALGLKDNIDEQLVEFAAPAAARFRLRSAREANASSRPPAKGPKNETGSAKKAPKASKSKQSAKVETSKESDASQESEESESEAEQRRSGRLRVKQLQSGGGRTRKFIKKRVLGSASSDRSLSPEGGQHKTDSSSKRQRTIIEATDRYEDDVFDSQDSATDLDYVETLSDFQEDGSGVAHSSDQATDHASADFDDEDEDEPAAHKKTKHRCQSFVILEMTAQQCARGRCTVVMQRPEWHPPTPRGRLRCSPYLRRLLHEAALGFGMTAGRLTACTSSAFHRLKVYIDKLGYTQHILSIDVHAKWLAQRCKHRMPSPKDYKTAVIGAAKADRVDKSPLTAIEILAERHPESFLAAVYPKTLDGQLKTKRINKDTRLECVIAPRWAQMAAILQVSRMGMYLDSSWRNKNAFKCPLTFLITINQYHRMIPLAAMVSNHADTAAYRFMLSEFNKAVKQTARDFLDGKFEYAMDGVDPDDLRSQCEIIADEGLAPAFMMIDGSEPEKRAIEDVYGCPIRCCQFHFMQALRSRIRRMFNRSAEAELLTSSVLEAVRKCQRCPKASLWDQYYQELGDEVTRIKQDEGQAWAELKGYLDKEWFSNNWRDTLVDYGLPYSATRDGPWSTNNYSEASFRTFDRIFLACRANKRLDRLIAILINQYFPFYENVPFDESRADPKLQRQLFRGLHRWETDCVHPCNPSAVPRPHRSKFGATIYCISPARRGKSSYQPHFCGRRPNNEREVCTCRYPELTGKRCLHLWAMATYELCGSVASFEDNASRVYAHIRKAGPSSRKKKLEDDPYANDRSEFKKTWGADVTELPKLETIDLNTGLELKQPAPTVTRSQLASGQSAVNPESPDPFTVSQPAEPRATVPARDTSPIRRRFQNIPENIDRASEEVTDSREEPEDPRTWSHSLPGRPRSIKPLNPGRSKPSRPTKASKSIRTPSLRAEPESNVANVNSSRQEVQADDVHTFDVVDTEPNVGAPESESHPLADPSRLSLPKPQRSSLTIVQRKPVQKLVQQHEPVGAVNTGIDCYALALFQVLLRLDNWSGALYAPRGQGFVDDPVVRLLRTFRDSLDGAEAESFPDLRQKLYIAGLVESAGRQIDPDDLLVAINHYLDSKSSSKAFTRSMQFTIISVVECPRCHDPHVVRDECGARQSIFLRVTADGSHLSMNDLVAQGLQIGEMREHDCISTCESNSDGSRFRSKSDLYLVNGPPVLHLHLSWPFTVRQASDTASNAADLQTDEVEVDTSVRDSIHIPYRLSIIATFRPGPPPPINYVLRGVICRVGRIASQGHYVAIVGSGFSWWVIDDDRVSHTSSPSDAAFESGHYPVHVFYEIEDTADGQTGIERDHSSAKAALLRKKSCIEGDLTNSRTTSMPRASNHLAPKLPEDLYFGGKKALFGDKFTATVAHPPSPSPSPTSSPKSPGRATKGKSYKATDSAPKRRTDDVTVPTTLRSPVSEKGAPSDANDTPLTTIRRLAPSRASISSMGSLLSFGGIPLQIPYVVPTKRRRSPTPEYIDLTLPKPRFRRTAAKSKPEDSGVSDNQQPSKSSWTPIPPVPPFPWTEPFSTHAPVHSPASLAKPSPSPSLKPTEIGSTLT